MESERDRNIELLELSSAGRIWLLERLQSTVFCL